MPQLGAYKKLTLKELLKHYLIAIIKSTHAKLPYLH